jgi:hypothetical protein
MRTAARTKRARRFGNNFAAIALDVNSIIAAA